jgi:hypothetical protein
MSRSLSAKQARAMADRFLQFQLKNPCGAPEFHVEFKAAYRSAGSGILVVR